MLEVFTGVAASLAGVGGFAWWLRHDGPIRLIAGCVAVLHPDPTRRNDAVEVLRCTGTHRSTRRRRKPTRSL
ncbi:hypothetical protein DFR76_110205 [Nocardia pseudobrasiliensis]|uniref:Uncharacterized protein n=2 Tax=Nocardia pseudobrasiliensis TaxID=45979 RepID=A0A370HYD4_9NOCA|nr:hypothetical protein DFR76_110205 [Nocardia pseudobrasiliensis]